MYFVKRCTSCNQAGRIRCLSCNATGKLKWFLELTVTFHNNIIDYIKKADVIPDKLLRLCQSKTIYTDKGNRVAFY